MLWTSTHTDTPPPLQLEPPKWGKQFIARTNAEAYIRAVARAQGYGLAAKGTKTEQYKIDGVLSDKRTARAYFACSRGPIKESKAVKRKTKTIKTNCPFEVSINYSRRTDTWKVSQNSEKKDNLTHNHAPVSAQGQLAYNRRFTSEVSKAIADMHRQGTAPKTIKSLVDVPEGCEPNLRDVYNATAQARARMLDGRTPIEGLVDELRKYDWASREDVSPDGKIKSLFVTSPDAISLARRYGSVVGMDCTYKTNAFALPLLHVVGSTSTHQTFTIALAFIHDETQPTYLWALKALAEVVYDGDPSRFPTTFTTDAEAALISAIDEVFPNSAHLLCQWHISTNLMKHCRPKMESFDNWKVFLKLWNKFVASKDQLEYDSSFAPMAEYATKYNCMKYVTETWLTHQQKFVAMYTSQHINFGYTVTSRVEGAHKNIKEFLTRGNKDLLGCYESFKLALDHQSHELNLAIGIDQTKRLAQSPPFFDELHGVISQYAISQALKQWNMIDENNPKPCSKGFQTSWGIPCAHVLADLRGKHQFLSPTEFHAQWHLTLPASTPESYLRLQECARREFDELINLPENALHKVGVFFSYLLSNM